MIWEKKTPERGVHPLVASFSYSTCCWFGKRWLRCWEVEQCANSPRELGRQSYGLVTGKEEETLVDHPCSALKPKGLTPWSKQKVRYFFSIPKLNVILGFWWPQQLARGKHLLPDRIDINILDLQIILQFLIYNIWHLKITRSTQRLDDTKTTENSSKSTGAQKRYKLWSVQDKILNTLWEIRASAENNHLQKRIK